MVEVEQIDRQAAYDHTIRILTGVSGMAPLIAQAVTMLSGEEDGCASVQAFARHRIAERDACAKVADTIAEEHDKCGGYEWAAGAEHAAVVISNRGRTE